MGGRWPCLGGVGTWWGSSELSGLWWMTARVFGFYCERRGPLAAICFHRGPRKTMRWVQGLSSIVLSCSVTHRAGWSRQKSREEGGPWTLHAAFPKDPVGCKAVLLLCGPGWRIWNTCYEFEYLVFRISGLTTNRFFIFNFKRAHNREAEGRCSVTVAPADPLWLRLCSVLGTRPAAELASLLYGSSFKTI